MKLYKDGIVRITESQTIINELKRAGYKELDEKSGSFGKSKPAEEVVEKPVENQDENVKSDQPEKPAGGIFGNRGGG
jgi:hypothetical protein